MERIIWCIICTYIIIWLISVQWRVFVMSSTLMRSTGKVYVTEVGIFFSNIYHFEILSPKHTKYYRKQAGFIFLNIHHGHINFKFLAPKVLISPWSQKTSNSPCPPQGPLQGPLKNLHNATKMYDLIISHVSFVYWTYFSCFSWQWRCHRSLRPRSGWCPVLGRRVRKIPQSGLLKYHIES